MSKANTNCILSLFDESSTFMGSLGRYSGGGAAYERSIYLELFNGGNSFSRVLSKETFVIENPRLNICMLGHPHEFIKLMREDKKKRDDGLMQRFLSNCPMPQFYSMEFIKEARNTERKFSMSILLYVIKRLHDRTILNDLNIKQPLPIKYCLDRESEKLFSETYSEYKEVSQSMNNNDTFIR
jgi:hypothetical protein